MGLLYIDCDQQPNISSFACGKKKKSTFALQIIKAHMQKNHKINAATASDELLAEGYL